MFIVNDPGPWQYFINRSDNVGKPLMEVKQKYLKEQMLFEQQQYQMYMNWLQMQGKGIPSPSMTPQVELLTESGQAMVTQDGQNLILT